MIDHKSQLTQLSINRKCPFAVVAMLSLMALGAGVEANPYGVCAHVSRDEFGARVETYDMMALAGLGYVRSDFDWLQCQRAKGGAWDFAMFDKMASAWSSTTCGASGSSPSRSVRRPGASPRANPPSISQEQRSSYEASRNDYGDGHAVHER